MDRQIVYPGSIPLDTDFLSMQRNVMKAEGYLAQALAGTSVVAWGLACNPTSPASMQVTVGPGAITSYTEVDTSSFGSLAADTNPLVKFGINEAATTFTLTAPTTSGQSINYLIEAQFQESDATPVVLPYVNAADPSQPYSGPSNSGTAQNTQRLQIVGLQLKAGAAATTGTQTTPGADTGWSPLYVITVNYGQTTITSGAISKSASAPFLPFTLAQLGSPSLLSGNGWKKYPDPNSPTGYFIEQWGTASVTGAVGGYVTNVTLPMSFPNAHLFSIAGFGGNSPPQNGGVAGYPVNTSQVEITVNAASASYAITYHCKGY